MSTFLDKTRNRETFEEKIRSKSPDTQKSTRSAIRNFEGFCKARYKRTVDEVISEYQSVEMDLVYDSLQGWINWNVKNELSPNSIPTMFSYLKTYLRYHRIMVTKEDVAEQLSFPHRMKEERHPLTKDEIRKILEVSSRGNRLRILAQLSSGMRQREMLQLRKRDLNLTQKRIMVNIPASITKTKKSRVTFFSKEVTPLFRHILRTMDDDDRIFYYTRKNSGKKRPKNTGHQYQNMLAKYVERTGLDQRYESGHHKITTHSFRAYFITKVSRHDPNLAKYFAGQEQSRDLLTYDRLTVEEKLEHYIKFERDLLVLDKDEKR